MTPATMPVPDSWRTSPPHLLVLGEEVYARALAQILAASCLRPEEIAAEPTPNEGGGYTKVLGSLRKVFLVAGTGQTAADLLRMHDSLWRWVEKLSPDGIQHDLAILFVVQPAAEGLEKAVAAGLGLLQFDADLPGHGVARMDESLANLLKTATSIRPQDFPPLRARRDADVRYAALKALLQADSDDAVASAVRQVNEAFQGNDYLMDLFCRPPSHRNGNLLRKWLSKAVTGEVTPYSDDTPAASPRAWLKDNLSF